MPDFSPFVEALKAVVSGSKDAKVMRPAEAELAARAAREGGAVTGGAAPVVPGVAPPKVDMPSMPAMPAPEPPPPVAVQAPADAPPPPAAAAEPAPAGAEADTSGAQPPPTAPTPSPADLRPADAPPPADPAVPSQPPSSVPNPAEPPKGAASEPIPPDSKLQPDPAATAVQQSAQRFVQADLGDFKLDATHLPNIDVMTSPDAVKATILRVAEDNKGAVDAARRGIVTDEQMAQLAADIPGGQPTVIRQVLEREIGTNLQTPEVALAARFIEQNTAGALQALAEKVASGKASAQEILDYTKHEQFLTEFNAQLAGAKAESGRTQRVLGLPVGIDQVGINHAADIIRNGDPDIARRAAAVRLAMSPKGIATIVQGGLIRRSLKAVGGMINRIMINGILSGPPTWIKIGVGNTVNTALNASDMFVAAAMGRFLPGEEHATLGAALANMHGVITGMSDGFRMAWRTMKTGQSLDGVLRFKEGAPQGTLAYLPELDKPVIGHIVSFIDQVIDAPGSRAVGATDEFTKTLGYRGYKEAQTFLAVRDALNAGTLKPEDAAAFAEKFMSTTASAKGLSDADVVKFNQIDQAAEAWAHRMSFQDPLGELGQKWTSILSATPGARLIVPFLRTSVNIFKQSLGERTLMGVFTNRFQQALAAGGAERDMAIGKMVTGTAIAAATARLVLSGRITGGGPQDPKARKMWEQDGKQPYSISFTNQNTGATTWHSLANLEPVASIVGTIADAIEIGSYIHADDQSDTMLDNQGKWNDAVAHIVVGIVNNTGNKTFMTGIAQFSEMWADPQRGFQNYVQHFVPSFVPYSGMLRFIRNEMDPYQRQAHTLLDQIKSNMPYYSEGLPLDKDLFGEPRLKKSGSYLGIASPIPEKVEQYDDVTKEIVSVMNDTRTVPVTMPERRISGGGSGKGMEAAAGMRLTDAEYSELVDHARAEPLANGKTFHETLSELIDSPVYQRATPPMRAVLLSSAQIAADKQGREKLLKENTDFRERLNDWVAQKNQMKYTQGTP